MVNANHASNNSALMCYNGKKNCVDFAMSFLHLFLSVSSTDTRYEGCNLWLFMPLVYNSQERQVFLLKYPTHSSSLPVWIVR